MPRGILSISWPQPIKGTLGIDMSASYMNGADRGHRSNIGIEKRGTDDRRNQMSVAVAGDRRSVAVSTNPISRCLDFLWLYPKNDRCDRQRCAFPGSPLSAPCKE